MARSLSDDCPYKKAQERSFSSTWDYRGFYRLRESREDGTRTFLCDTYDGHTWLDIFEHRDCERTCLCRTFKRRNSNTALAFSVTKEPTSITVKMHSGALRDTLKTLGVPDLPDREDSFDGLQLLQMQPSLAEALENRRKRLEGQSMRTDNDISTNRGSVVNYDLGVLVELFLNDPEVFRSYGFDNIYRDGFLDHDRWQRW